MAQKCLWVIKFPKLHPYIKAKKTYVDISEWTTIMSQHHAGHFHEIFGNLLKANIIMITYLVPPYVIRWEGTRKNALKYLQRIPMMI
jgi:hypothetical protein